MLTTLIVLFIILSSPFVFVFGQILYQQITHHRRKRWEATIRRTESGVRVECLPYFLEGSSRDALLLIHGFADSPSVFKPFAHHLHRAGLTVKALLLPGFGVPVEQQANVNEELWIDYIEQEYQELSDQYDNVWIIAHSLGCAVGLHWAALHPHSAKGLFLLAPLIKVSDKRSLVLHPEIWFNLGTRFMKRINYLENVLPFDIKKKLGPGALPKDQFIHFAVYQALFNLTRSFENTPFSVDLPVAVYLAGDDHIVDNQSTNRFFESLKSPKLSIRTMHQSGHILPMDHEWQTIADEIIHVVTDASKSA